MSEACWSDDCCQDIQFFWDGDKKNKQTKIVETEREWLKEKDL